MNRIASGLTVRDIYQKGVFFYSDSDSYCYVANCLADGLSQLGIPVFSNIDYTEPAISDFRFHASKDKDLIQGASCLLLNLQQTYNSIYKWQMVMFEPLHERMFALSMQDNVSEFGLYGVNAFFCCHENRFRRITGNRVPVAFGLSSSIMRRAVQLPDFSSRSMVFLDSFRRSLGQEVRACMDLALIPQLERYFTVNQMNAGNGRLSPEFYDLLASCMGSLAYGGFFFQNLLKNEYFARNPELKEFNSNLFQSRETVVLRWDSWRFWESLAFGCATLSLDFDKYGFMLPVMPENWKHYIGLDLSDIRRDVERMHDERDRLPEIAEAGRCWAIEHYSPVAVSRRFIAELCRYSSDAGVV